MAFRIGDQPNLPEAELIEQLWQGSEQQPITGNPEIDNVNGEIHISCATEGASIGNYERTTIQEPEIRTKICGTTEKNGID